jgi:hypothetical protein
LALRQRAREHGNRDNPHREGGSHGAHPEHDRQLFLGGSAVEIVGAREEQCAGATNGSKVGVYMQGMKLDQTKIARRQLGTALALFIDGSWGNCIHDKGFADVGANRTW